MHKEFVNIGPTRPLKSAKISRTSHLNPSFLRRHASYATSTHKSLLLGSPLWVSLTTVSILAGFFLRNENEVRIQHFTWGLTTVLYNAMNHADFLESMGKFSLVHSLLYLMSASLQYSVHSPSVFIVAPRSVFPELHWTSKSKIFRSHWANTRLQRVDVLYFHPMAFPIQQCALLSHLNFHSK